MKNQLSKKLFAFIVTAMMFSASANAQIVYTDINPDILKTRSYVGVTTVTTEQSIDVNNDGIPDLKFTLTAKRSRGSSWGPNPVPGPGGTPPPSSPNSPSTGSVTVSPLNGSAIISSSSGYPLKMNVNDVVNSSANWIATANQKLISRSTYQPTQLGNWTTATDGFLGLRIISGSQTRYCWVRLNVAAFTGGTNAATLTIKDYAFDSTPNHLINAGATFGARLTEEYSLNENDLLLNVFPNPVSISTTISISLSQSQNVSLKVFDMSGRLISTLADKYFDAGENKLVWNATDLNAGTYFLQVKTNAYSRTEKLVVTK